MSQDTYLNSHTIKTIGNNKSIKLDSFSIEGTTTEGPIRLITKGDDAHIYLETGEAGESGGSIYIRNTGDDGEINIRSESAGIYWQSGVSSSVVSGTSGYGKLTIRSDGNSGAEFSTTNGDIEIDSSENISISATSSGTANSVGVISLRSTGGSGFDSEDMNLFLMDWSGIEMRSQMQAKISSTKQIIIEANTGGTLPIGSDAITIKPNGFKTTIEGDVDIEGALTAESFSTFGTDLIQTERLSTNKILTGSSGGIEIIGAGFASTIPDENIVNNDIGFVLKVSNTNQYGDGIIIEANWDDVSLNDPNVANHFNNWMRFKWNGEIKGAIQGAKAYSYGDGDIYPAFVSEFFSEGEGHLSYAPAVSPTVLVNGINVAEAQIPLSTLQGYAQFVSGNEDFGEFFEVGDASEWSDLSPQSPYVGIPEGTLVWVVGSKFFRKKQEGLGVPMITSRRAIVIGSNLPSSDENVLGEVLSFIGKLPVLIRGAAETGSLLVPESDKNYCTAVRKEEATLQQYMASIGTVLGNCPEFTTHPKDHPIDPGKKTNFHLVLCATGVK